MHSRVPAGPGVSMAPPNHLGVFAHNASAEVASRSGTLAARRSAGPGLPIAAGGLQPSLQRSLSVNGCLPTQRAVTRKFCLWQPACAALPPSV